MPAKKLVKRKLAKKAAKRKAAPSKRTGAAKAKSRLKVGRTVSVISAAQIFDTLDVSAQTIRDAQNAIQ